MNFEIIEFIYLILPALLGYGTQFFCPIKKDAGENVKFKPPAVIFRIVWIILFLMLGISFMLSMKINKNKFLTLSLYICLILSLVVWLYLYGCKNNKKLASWILILSIGVSLSCFAISENKIKILLSPLIAWSIFALLMNTTEVQNTN